MARRRAAHVRCKVAQRIIRFMTDGRHDWRLAVIHRFDNGAVIKAPQVFSATTATADDDKLYVRILIGSSDAFRNLWRCLFALYRHRKELKLHQRIATGRYV